MYRHPSFLADCALMLNQPMRAFATKAVIELSQSIFRLVFDSGLMNSSSDGCTHGYAIRLDSLVSKIRDPMAARP